MANVVPQVLFIQQLQSATQPAAQQFLLEPFLLIITAATDTDTQTLSHIGANNKDY